MIICSRCKKLFNRSGKRRLNHQVYDEIDPYYDWCDECICENKEELTNDFVYYDELKADNKLRKSVFDKLTKKQSSCCLICGKSQKDHIFSDGFTKKLSIDHDHKTGLIRGLLCHRCNHMLGLAQDNIELLYEAIEYLKYFKEKVDQLKRSS
jgi:hypothetical protein